MINMTGNSLLAKNKQGTILVEMVVSISILVIMSTTFAMAFMAQQRLLELSLCEMVVTEIVDGEMEVFLAGEWKAYPEGIHDYAVQSKAAQALPAGKFQLTRKGQDLRLEWIPEKMPKPNARIRREGVIQ